MQIKMGADSAEKHNVIQERTSGCKAETDLTKLMQLWSAGSAHEHNLI